MLTVDIGAPALSAASPLGGFGCPRALSPGIGGGAGFGACIYIIVSILDIDL